MYSMFGRTIFKQKDKELHPHVFLLKNYIPFFSKMALRKTAQ